MHLLSLLHHICSRHAAGAINSRAVLLRGGHCQLRGTAAETSACVVAISSAPASSLLYVNIKKQNEKQNLPFETPVPGWGTAGGVSSPWHLNAAWQLLLRTRMGTRGSVTGAAPLARAQDPSFPFSRFYSFILRARGRL